MWLKCHTRLKDGKEHRYWSIVESVRCSRQRIVQRHVLYLGELNDSQRAGWTRCLEAVDGQGHIHQLALFPADRGIPVHAQGYGVQVRLEAMRLERPRQWGACWLFTVLWAQLKLDEFWQPRLPDSREGTSWYHTLLTSCAYRLIDPGSEWRLHWARTAAAPAHRTQRRTKPSAHPTQTATAAATPAKDHRDVKYPRPCGADLD